jgi:hypothetical protein
MFSESGKLDTLLCWEEDKALVMVEVERAIASPNQLEQQRNALALKFANDILIFSRN